jgi:membrane protein required for colicin V production
MGAWNWLDWTLAGVVSMSVVTAFAKGFTRELISLAAVLAGLVVATIWYEKSSLWFEDLAHSHRIALGLGFLALFLGTLLVGLLVSLLARKLINTAGLQGIDRLLGAGFGLIRGVLVDSVLIMALVAFAIKPEAIQGSVLAPYVTNGARAIAIAMPGGLKTQFRDGFQRLRHSFNQSAEKSRS